MDKISKALKRLTPAERQVVKEILLRLEGNQLTGLDHKKLTGRRSLFRIRKGDLRIIFERNERTIKLLAIERRSEKTYRNVN